MRIIIESSTPIPFRKKGRITFPTPRTLMIPADWPIEDKAKVFDFKILTKNLKEIFLANYSSRNLSTPLTHSSIPQATSEILASPYMYAGVETSLRF